MGWQHRLVSRTNCTHIRRAAFVAAAAIGLATPAFAATYNFIPGAGTTAPGSVNGSTGDWANGANWATGTTTGTVPGSGDQASSSSGAITTISSAVPVVNEVRFANNAPGGTINTISGNAYTSNGTAYLTINSGGSLSIQSTNGTSNGSFTMGNATGSSGTLTINTGGSLTTGVASGKTQAGESIGGLESVIIGNSANSATATGPVGTFNMNDGLMTVANNFINGYGATVAATSMGYATGNTTQIGGTINVAGAVIVGAKGHGTYVMSGGSLNQNGTNPDGNSLGRDAFYLGQIDTTTAGNAEGGQGTFTESGTAAVNIANGLYIANQSNTTGTYTISGGSLAIAGDMSVGAATGAGVGTATAVAASNNAGRFQVNGNLAATITANHMTANTANSTLGFEIGSSAGTSLIDLTAASVGGVNYDGSALLSTSTLVDIDPMGGFTPAAGDVYTLMTATSISAVPTLTLDGDAFDSSTLSIITNGDGTQSLIDTVSAVPEPASLALLSLAGGLVIRRRRA